MADHRSMAPAFSKIPIPAIPGISVISGLMCTDADCYALFSNLEDSETHAVEAHAGKVDAITCGIYEHVSKSGGIRLYRVLDENESLDGEDAALLPPVTTQSSRVNEKRTSAHDSTTKDGGKSRQIGQSDEESPPICGLSTSLARVLDLPPKTGNLEPWPSAPSSSPFIPTPPCTQPNSSQSQPLSRQSTASSFEITSPSSSFNLNDAGDEGDGQLRHILAALEEIVDQCRICWVRKEVTHPHKTFRCPTKICSGSDWRAFKSGLQFPPGIICYFCFASYGPPFNHKRAPPDTKQTPELCEYPDVLKELVYVLYQDRSLREKIFASLGVASPPTLDRYKTYITKMQGGLLGAYKVVSTYLDVRKLEELSA